MKSPFVNSRSTFCGIAKKPFIFSPIQEILLDIQDSTLSCDAIDFIFVVQYILTPIVKTTNHQK